MAFCSKLLPSTHLWYHKILLFGLGYLYAYFDQSINFSKQSIQDIHTLEKHLCDTSKTLFPKWLLSQHRIQCVNSSLGEYFFWGEGLFQFFCGGGNVLWNFILMGKALPLWFRPTSHPLSQKCLKTFLPWANSSQGPVGEKSRRQCRNKGQPK